MYRRIVAALKAARAAASAMAVHNVERAGRGEQEINFGLALHPGEVTYGNIGAKNRLDFTVIGPAVNHAARLEKLAAELGKNVVTSASFAAAVTEPLHGLGLHRLRWSQPTSGSIHATALIDRRPGSDGGAGRQVF